MHKKITKRIVAPTLALSLLFPTVSLAASSYTVTAGDTLWKVALKTTTGIDELIQANPQIPNINMIYPGQKINVPLKRWLFSGTRSDLVSQSRKSKKWFIPIKI